MRLRNKKTGEILGSLGSFIIQNPNRINCEAITKYDSLAELNAEWEDMPEEQKEFWFIDSGGEVKEATYLTENDKSSLRNFGNYFKTKEEAEKTAEKLQAWKRLKDKGFKITLHGYKGSAWLEANWGNLQGDYSDIIFLFGGEE